MRSTPLARLILSLCAAAVVALGGVLAYQRFRAAAAEQVVSAAVQRGGIAATTTAIGNVAAREARLSFATAGTLSEMLVKVGDRVGAGQPLARLDAADLELHVQQAQSQLSIARIKLQQLTQAASSADVASAEASYDAVVASAATADANARLKTLSDGAPGPDATTQAAAAAGVGAARARLDQVLKVSAPPGDVVLLETVHGAEIDLSIAQRALDRATMRAPFDGVVQAVSASASEAIASGTPVLKLIDPNEVRLDATVDGADIGQVTVGETAQISLDDHPARTFAGRVAAVAAGGSLVQGMVSFPITVSIDRPDVALVPGLAAHVTISGPRKDNVLLLPAQAVRRLGRDSAVDLLQGDTTQPRIVHVGISDGASVEILDGVSEGDRVLLPH